MPIFRLTVRGMVTQQGYVGWDIQKSIEVEAPNLEDAIARAKHIDPYNVDWRHGNMEYDGTNLQEYELHLISGEGCSVKCGGEFEKVEEGQDPHNNIRFLDEEE